MWLFAFATVIEVSSSVSSFSDPIYQSVWAKVLKYEFSLVIEASSAYSVFSDSIYMYQPVRAINSEIWIISGDCSLQRRFCILRCLIVANMTKEIWNKNEIQRRIFEINLSCLMYASMTIISCIWLLAWKRWLDPWDQSPMYVHMKCVVSSGLVAASIQRSAW